MEFTHGGWEGLKSWKAGRWNACSEVGWQGPTSCVAAQYNGGCDFKVVGQGPRGDQRRVASQVALSVGGGGLCGGTGLAKGLGDGLPAESALPGARAQDGVAGRQHLCAAHRALARFLVQEVHAASLDS